MSQIYLKYGSYRHDDCEAAVEISRTSLTSDAGQKYASRWRFVIDGVLHAADQSALDTAITALEAAYADDGFDLGLYYSDSNSQVATHFLDSSEAIGGVRIVEFGYPDNGRVSAELSTFRTYRIVAEADFPDTTSIGLLSYTEVLTFEGGGPRFVFLQPINGLPQRQQVAQATPFRVTQTGEAVGHLARPTPNSPIWPQAEHRDQRRIERPTPKVTRVGNSSAYTDYAVRWSYFFESATELTGNSVARI